MLPSFNRPTHAPADEAEVIDLLGGDYTLATPSRGLYVGVTGDVKVDMATTGTAITFPNMAGGMVHPISVKKVYQIGTAATGLRSVY